MKKLLITVAAVIAGIALSKLIPLPAALMPEVELPVVGKFVSGPDIVAAVTILATLYLAHKAFSSVASPV